MILGTGQDLCDIRRIEKTLARFGERFENRCFTEIERAKANRRAGGGLKAATYAKRYAAKEACAKALGTGLSRGVAWKDIGVVNLVSGQPTIELRGAGLKRLQEITPKGMKHNVQLTLTDEYPYAQALVIIEGLEK